MKDQVELQLERASFKKKDPTALWPAMFSNPDVFSHFKVEFSTNSRGLELIEMGGGGGDKCS